MKGFQVDKGKMLQKRARSCRVDKLSQILHRLSQGRKQLQQSELGLYRRANAQNNVKSGVAA